ncbi:MAG: uncharacterized protein QOG87_1599 [Actinomycetota bacterium]
MTAEDDPVPAGPFSVWLVGMRRALDGDAASDVPCGGCTACCTSSQFVHIGPDEADALAHIPAALQFPAPGLPEGHVVLGYDERGHCPMLVDGACSIYVHRPRTCRTYDCRVFPAAGVEVEDDKPAIAQRAARWRFDFPAEADRIHHEAVQAAARFVRDRGDSVNATRLAVLAVEMHDAFLDHDDTG